MKGDLVLYDSLVWLMGSLEGLPARGPEPLGRGLALRQDQGAQRLCSAPKQTHPQTVLEPRQAHWFPTVGSAPLASQGPFSHRGTHWLCLSQASSSFTLPVEFRSPWTLFLNLLF